MTKPVCLITILLCLAPLAWAQDTKNDPALPGFGRAVPVLGRISWPGKDLTNTVVRIFADPGMRQLVETYPTGGARGSVVFALMPGTYYLSVFSDQDGDRKASPGDGLGFYGVTDMEAQPRPFRVDQGAGAMSVSIPIAMAFGKRGADGRMPLEPVEVRALEPCAVERETPVTGKVKGRIDSETESFVLLIPVAAEFPPRAAFVRDDDSFELTGVPGTYNLIAVENFNHSEAIDTGDFMGVADYEPAMGASLAELDLKHGGSIGDLRMRLNWALARDGRLRSGDGTVLGPRINTGGLPGVVLGTVTRDGEPVPGAHVKAYADAEFTELHHETKCDEKGRFALAMAPASYFITVLHDVDGDGATGPGDELGFSGVSMDDPSSKPAPLTLEPSQIMRDARIPLVMVIGRDAKPTPIKIGDTPAPQPEEDAGAVANP